ncbi:helix-turn-helix transcriptional regulator [Sphingobium aromaticiconvertens]|uniref:helix-turn-helix domain-containing protein n=1 Tax=Sphingobium aromaticiconvertens TaxID=365341 RepID=UPI00301724EF
MALGQLSDRQRRCLELVSQGLTSKEIAPILDVTPGVVDNYIAAAIAKLGASGRRDAARIVLGHEKVMVQPLHLQSEAIAPALPLADEMHQADQTQGTDSKPIGTLHHLFSLPPMGGRENDLNVADRLLVIARISFLAAVLLIATIVTVQGVILLLT